MGLIFDDIAAVKTVDHNKSPSIWITRICFAMIKISYFDERTAGDSIQQHGLEFPEICKLHLEKELQKKKT